MALSKEKINQQNLSLKRLNGGYTRQRLLNVVLNMLKEKNIWRKSRKCINKMEITIKRKPKKKPERNSETKSTIMGMRISLDDSKAEERISQLERKMEIIKAEKQKKRLKKSK